MKVKGVITDEEIVKMMQAIKDKEKLSDTELGKKLGGVSKVTISNVMKLKQKPGLKFSIIVMHHGGYECATQIIKALMPDGLEQHIKRGRIAAEMGYAKKRQDDETIAQLQNLIAAFGEIEVKERPEETKQKGGRPRKNDDKKTAQRKVAS